MTHNTREVEEILRKFKTTIMWETEHEEGLLMSNYDALEWLRVALTNLEKLHQEELSELGAGITNGYEDILKKTEQTLHHQLQKARNEEKERAIEIIKDELRTAPLEVQMTKGIVFASIVGRIQAELNQPNNNQTS